MSELTNNQEDLMIESGLEEWRESKEYQNRHKTVLMIEDFMVSE